MRILITGIFDLFHYGHVKAFEQVKEAFPGCILVAGCLSDITAEIIKRKPILNLEERMKIVASCKFIDHVIVDPWSPNMTDKEQVQFVIDNNFDVFAHEDHPTKYNLFKERGLFFKVVYTETISTTEIIKRVKAYA